MKTERWPMTESESGPRTELGLFLRDLRENYFSRIGKCDRDTGKTTSRVLSRCMLAGRAKVSEQVITNLEHGIPNPERCVFEKVIFALKLSDEDKVEAYRLLNMFTSPPPFRRRRRVKLHSNFSIRTRRRRRV